MISEHTFIYKTMKDDTICEVNLVDRENVELVQSQMANQKQAMQVAEFFKTLSDPARMRIIEALSIRRLCVCDLAYIVGLSQSATSHHLRSLRDKRLVKFEKNGKMAYYSLDDEHVAGAFAAVLKHVVLEHVVHREVY